MPVTDIEQKSHLPQDYVRNNVHRGNGCSVLKNLLNLNNLILFEVKNSEFNFNKKAL
ncbi:hypothetical protein L291_3878 [Acinetobacter guillouiae MSP4-18]|jgi:hypothetical protein|nr:hypothetical protein L291_3878 [Acinetobacter guillouiae MSP4-18]